MSKALKINKKVLANWHNDFSSQICLDSDAEDSISENIDVNFITHYASTLRNSNQGNFRDT